MAWQGTQFRSNKFTISEKVSNLVWFIHKLNMIKIVSHCANVSKTYQSMYLVNTIDMCFLTNYFQVRKWTLPFFHMTKHCSQGVSTANNDTYPFVMYIIKSLMKTNWGGFIAFVKLSIWKTLCYCKRHNLFALFVFFKLKLEASSSLLWWKSYLATMVLCSLSMYFFMKVMPCIRL